MMAGAARSIGNTDQFRDWFHTWGQVTSYGCSKSWLRGRRRLGCYSACFLTSPIDEKYFQFWTYLP